MIFEVFRQEKPGGYHTHCGEVQAPDRELASLFAQIQHGRRKTTNSLWIVPKTEITAVDTDDAHFGGTTDKSYRWTMAYADISPPTEEVEESDREQRAEQRENQSADEREEQRP